MLHNTKFTILAELLKFTLISINIKLQDCPTYRCSVLPEILKKQIIDIFFFCFLYFSFFRVLKVKKKCKKLSEFEYKIYQNNFVLHWHHAISLSTSVLADMIA